MVSGESLGGRVRRFLVSESRVMESGFSFCFFFLSAYDVRSTHRSLVYYKTTAIGVEVFTV